MGWVLGLMFIYLFMMRRYCLDLAPDFSCAFLLLHSFMTSSRLSWHALLSFLERSAVISLVSTSATYPVPTVQNHIKRLFVLYYFGHMHTVTLALLFPPLVHSYCKSANKNDMVKTCSQSVSALPNHVIIMTVYNSGDNYECSQAKPRGYSPVYDIHGLSGF